MRKMYIVAFLMSVFLCFEVTACTKSGRGAGSTEQPDTPSDGMKYENPLVVYFSRTGNTERMAAVIHTAAGGDMTEIETVTPYPESYDHVLDQAREEINSGYRPPLSTRIENMESYDIVFIGYPIWFGTVPPPAVSFLTQYDLSGKTIVPFCTSGGSGGSASYDVIKSLCPASTVLDGLQISGSSAGTSQGAVNRWLHEIGVK